MDNHERITLPIERVHALHVRNREFHDRASKTEQPRLLGRGGRHTSVSDVGDLEGCGWLPRNSTSPMGSPTSDSPMLPTFRNFNLKLRIVVNLKRFLSTIFACFDTSCTCVCDMDCGDSTPH